MASTDFWLGEFVVQPGADRLVGRGGAARIDLEPKTMAVLLVLVECSGQVVSSDELIRRVWHNRPMGENPVYKAVAKLRRAFADEAERPRYIETIPRKGYRLVVAPEALQSMPPATEPALTSPAVLDSPQRRKGHLVLTGALVVVCALAVPALLQRPVTTDHARGGSRHDTPSDVRLQFSGLDHPATTDGADIDAALRERLQGLPGISLRESAGDESLASLRLTGSVRDAGAGRQHVRLRLDGPLGPGLWSREFEVDPPNFGGMADSAAAAVHEARHIGRDEDGARKLSFEALQLYLLSRSELRDRRPGFASRLRADAAELVAAAPDFAPGHALLAVACGLQIAFATQRSITLSDESANDAGAALACAREAVRRALELDPRLAEAHAAAGLLAMQEYSLCRAPCDQLGDLDAAQSSLELAVRLDPSLPEARTWLGAVYQERGDIVRASEQAEAALALDPLNPVAVYNANNFRMARGDHATVRERLLVLARRPGSPSYVYAQLAENAIDTGQIQDALHWIRRLTAQDNGRDVQVTAGAMLTRIGRNDEARALLATHEDPATIDRGETLWLALEAHVRIGGPSAVLAYLESQQRHRQSAAKPPLAADSDREWQQFQGFALVLTGDPARAIPLLEHVFGTSGAPRVRLADIGREADLANALAWAHREQGHSARAREVAEGTLAALERVASAGFDNGPRFALTQALAYELAGQREHARAEVERAVSMGWAPTVDVRRDPRWAELMATGAQRVADTRSQ